MAVLADAVHLLVPTGGLEAHLLEVVEVPALSEELLLDAVLLGAGAEGGGVHLLAGFELLAEPDRLGSFPGGTSLGRPSRSWFWSGRVCMDVLGSRITVRRSALPTRQRNYVAGIPELFPGGLPLHPSFLKTCRRTAIRLPRTG